ncbi:serine/threonine protein kinase [Roseiflexus sp.]|uniref:serine/threonine protein kinase n=1 Tax=Roseiflexus sp. TaxID=2562120 RepID=UPI00398AD275
MLTPGTFLQDRYFIERLLDRSSSGDLYLALDQRTRQHVDVKAITRTGTDVDARFARESAALASLRHPALPAVVDMFAAPLGRFIVFDHIPGLTLEDIRARASQGRIDADAAIRLIQPVLDALDHMHRHLARLVHRDVRPANIRVTPAGQVYLTNPAIAGQPVAPFAGDDLRADLYGIGATIYTLLTGMTPPHPSQRAQSDTLRPVNQICPELSPELAQGVHRLLSLDPTQQYASAADANHALVAAAPDVVCPRCSKPNRASARFCRSCGAPLPASDPRSAIRAFIERLPSQLAAPGDTVTPAQINAFDFQSHSAATVTSPPTDPVRIPPQSVTPGFPPTDAPTVTSPPTDAATFIAPPKPPASVEATAAMPAAAIPAPPAAGSPAAAPVGNAQRRQRRLIGGIIAAIVLLLACLGGGYLALAVIGVSPGPTAIADVSPTLPTGGSAATAEARQNATATAIAAAQRATTTARAEQTATAQAATVTPTATPTPTTPPTPTATPTPQLLVPQPGTLALAEYQAQTRGLRQLLFETFDRGERTKAIWPQMDDENRRAALRDNLYYLTLKKPNLTRSYSWERNLGNTYNIELSVAFQTVGAPAAAGIAFDMQPDANSGVIFAITNDKRWLLWTFVDGRIVPEQSTDVIPDEVIVDGVGTNNLWVVRTPNETQLWINSKHVATVPPSPFPGGRGGVCVSSFSNLTEPATVIVDNFRVRTP